MVKGNYGTVSYIYIYIFIIKVISTAAGCFGFIYGRADSKEMPSGAVRVKSNDVVAQPVVAYRQLNWCELSILVMCLQLLK
jgi:hypothetical protein